MDGRTFLPVRTVAELVGLNIDFVDGVVILSETPITPTPQPTPAPTPSSGAPSAGRWAGNVFTSEYLGVRITIPSGWHIEPPEALLAYAGLGFDMIGIDMSDEFWAAAGANIMYDIMASSQRGASINIVHERIDPMHGNITARQYIESSLQAFEMVGLDVNHSFGGSRQIGNREWLISNLSFNVEGIDISMRQYIIVQGGFATIMTVGSVSGSEGINEMEAFISGL
jgi:hypothetical protein